MDAPRPYMGPKLKIGGALKRASEAGRAGGDERNELKELEEAAKQFESLLLHEMIKAMRKTVPEGGLTEQSFGRKIFTEMQDEENATTMATMGGIGLHRILVDQLGGDLLGASDPGRGRMVHPLGGGSHRVSSGFGRRKHPIHGDHRMHAGMDMPAATGTAVAAARGGTVSYAGSLGGYGLMIELEHSDGLTCTEALMLTHMTWPS